MRLIRRRTWMLPPVIGAILSLVLMDAAVQPASVTYSARSNAPTTIANLQVTNLQSTQFAVVFTTATAVPATVEYSTSSAMSNPITVFDDRDGSGPAVTASVIHRFTVTGLTAGTQYFFEPFISGQAQTNAGQPYTATTTTFAPNSGLPTTGEGKVTLSTGTPPPAATVLLVGSWTNPDNSVSAPISTLSPAAVSGKPFAVYTLSALLVTPNGSSLFAVANGATLTVNAFADLSGQLVTGGPVQGSFNTTLGIFVPTEITLQVPTPVTNTNTPTGTPTNTSTGTASSTETPTPTFTQTNTPTITPSTSATATAPPATGTATSTGTTTPVLPTNTATNTGTGTLTATATNTPVPPTGTATNSPTITTTPADTATSTVTSTATNTGTNTDTATPTATATHTTTPSSTNTPTSTATNTVTNTPTDTPTITITPTVTNTPTITNTPTVTNTPTITDTPADTATSRPYVYSGGYGVLPTSTATATDTASPTVAPTNSATDTASPTTAPAATQVPSNTNTPAATSVVTQTATPTATSTTTITPTMPISASVVLSGTQLLLTGSANPVLVNETETLTASVQTADGKAVTDGIVSFMDGTLDLEDITVDGTGTAVLQDTPSDLGLAPGPHDITAVYSNSSTNFSETTNVLTLDVQVPTRITAITAKPNPATTSDKITFTVKVAVAKGQQAVTGQTTDGTVTFTEGSRTVGSVKLKNGGATFTTGPFIALHNNAAHQIVAHYAGNNYYAASVRTLKLNVAAG